MLSRVNRGLRSGGVVQTPSGKASLMENKNGMLKEVLEFSSVNSSGWNVGVNTE